VAALKESPVRSLRARWPPLGQHRSKTGVVPLLDQLVKKLGATQSFALSPVSI